MGSNGAGAAARMDPEEATELAWKRVTFLLLDVPQHTVLDVDTQLFSVGPRFRGIKMVPPGPHSSTTAPPTGTGMSLHLLFDSSLLPTLLRWSFEDGMLKRRDWRHYQKRRYSEAVKRFEFDGQLGPYNLDSFGDWKQL